MLLTVGSSLILPGTSYLFLWPLLAGLLALAVHFAAPQSPSLLRQLLLLLPVTLSLLLFGTAVYLVQLMFGVDIFPVSAVFVVLLLALVFPYLNFRALPHPAIWAAIPLLAGILLLVTAGLVTNYSDQQPRPNFLFYSMDADAATAAWVAETTLPDETLAPWLGDTPGESIMEAYFPGSWQDSVWVSDAPLVSEPAPEMTVVEDRIAGNVRSLRLNLRSHREAWAIMADITAESAILEAELYGERHSRETRWDQVFFKVIAVPIEGVDITLKLRPGVPITLRLADVTLSLPAIGGRAIQIASPLRTGYGGGHGIDSMTLIHRQYRID